MMGPSRILVFTQVGWQRGRFDVRLQQAVIRPVQVEHLDRCARLG